MSSTLHTEFIKYDSAGNIVSKIILCGDCECTEDEIDLDSYDANGSQDPCDHCGADTEA